MYKLHALDLATGSERQNSPAVIEATAPGHPEAIFHAVQALDRSGLVYSNGQVLISYASSDSDRGWMMAYDGTNLSQTAVFCVTPTGNLGAIWGSGAAPVVDSTGNVYFMTGNGTFDGDTGGENYSMSMLKLTPHGNRFRVTDFFTPYDEQKLSAADYDLASGGVILLPDQSGGHKHEITGGFKTGKVFMVDRDNMGKFNPNGDQVVQSIQLSPDGFWSTPAYFNGRIYWAGGGNWLSAYDLKDGEYVLPRASHGSEILKYPGATPSISANGAQDGIVWIIANLGGHPVNNPPAVLLAYDANDVSHELYNSKQIGSRDQAGPAVKFTVPTVAQGKVYVGTQTELDVYGLLP
jgi:hypothetical protein